MAELSHKLPEQIRVRLHWDGGRIETLDKTIGDHHYHYFHADAEGEKHRFQDSGDTDAEGYRIFKQADELHDDEINPPTE